MQLIIQKRGYRWFPLIALAMALALLALVAHDSSAVHNDGFLEMDGDVEFQTGTGVDPCATAGCVNPPDPCPPAANDNPVDCIRTATAATFDWADDNGSQELCVRGADGYITEASPLPTPSGGTLDDVQCSPDFIQGATDDVSYHTGSDKDFQEITTTGTDDWACTDAANATSKADLLNAGFLLVTESDDDQLVYFMAERDSEHGDVFNGFWVLANQISIPGAGDPIDCSTSNSPFNFSGVHACGDVLIRFNYESGGRVSSAFANRWDDSALADVGLPTEHTIGCDGVDGTQDDCSAAAIGSAQSHDTPTGVLCIVASTGTDCRAAIAGDNFCGRVNGPLTCRRCDSLEKGPGEFETPWEPSDGDPSAVVAVPTFSEVGINLSAFGLEIPCVGAFVAESRSSSSIDATLKDFALAPTGAVCSSSVETDIHSGSRTATEPPAHTVLTDCTQGTDPSSCGTTGTIVAGTTIHDAAFLSLGGPGGTATGTLTFTRYTTTNCSDAGTAETPINISQAIGTTQRYESADFTPTAGTTAVGFKAAYSGDSNNDIPASTSLCEPLNVVNPNLALDKDAAPVASVTYTYQLKNSGDVDLTSPSVADDKCSPAQVLSGGFNTGDTNSNGEFDPNEIWNFACTTPISLTDGVGLTNTATGTAVAPFGGGTLTKVDVVTTTATFTVSDPNGE